MAGAYAICSDEEMECPGQMNPDGKFANFDNITSKTKHIMYMTINVTILAGDERCMGIFLQSVEGSTEGTP